jgi:hypothetical protein
MSYFVGILNKFLYKPKLLFPLKNDNKQKHDFIGECVKPQLQALVGVIVFFFLNKICHSFYQKIGEIFEFIFLM